MTTLRDAAIAYAGRGWFIFPVRPRAKEPLTPGGFKDATTDADQVGAWWDQHPDANIAIVPGRSGLLAIDLDGQEGEDAAMNLGLLSEPTLTVTTARGRHLYYRHPPGGEIGNKVLAPGLDVRGDAGYTLVPPSVHPSGAVYGWAGRFKELKDLPPLALAAIQNGARSVRAAELPAVILEGARNNTLTSLAGSARCRGATATEILALLKAVNAERCRPPLDEDELAAIASSVGRYPTGLDSVGASAGAAAHTNGASPDTARPVVVVIGDVTPEEISWLWLGRVPLGKVTVLEGDPGLGKSSMLLDLAARLSVGGTTPDGHRLEPGATVVLTAEDGLGDTVAPRLMAAGGDLSRIVAVTAVQVEGQTEQMMLPVHLDALQTAIEEQDAKLVIVDPLVAFLGSEINSWRDHDVRRALRPLAQLAEETGAAIVVIRHLTKGAGPAIYRGGGSIGIAGAARSVLLVARDPEDESRRILASVKSNLAAEPPSLAFYVEDDGHGRARIRWDGTSPHRANALVAAPQEPEERSQTDEAVAWLQSELEGDSMKASDVQRRARQAGIAEKALRRARERLGVKPRKLSFDGPWLWALPRCPEGPQDAQDAYIPGEGILGALGHLGEPETYEQTDPEGSICPSCGGSTPNQICSACEPERWLAALQAELAEAEGA